MTPTRAEVRQAFAGLLTAELVGDGKPLKAVYAYRVGDFKGETPVATLGSGGTDLTPLTMRGAKRGYLIDLFIFVLYAHLDDEGKFVLDAQGLPVWDEQNAEDMMDTLDLRVTELIARLGSNLPFWQKVGYAGPSQTEVLAVGGLPYYLEVIPLRFEVF